MAWHSELIELGYTDVIMIAILFYVIYHFFFKKHRIEEPAVPVEPALPPLPMQDLTIEELRKFDGIDDPHILIAVAGRIYDVSQGKSFYGPGGVYDGFAGHDATRAFATFDVKQIKDEHDDISDLTVADLEDALEWEARFRTKYLYVGRLLQAGEKPRDYDGAVATNRYSDLPAPSIENGKIVERDSPIKTATTIDAAGDA